MGHSIIGCDKEDVTSKLKDGDDKPYSNALRIESSLMGKESFLLVIIRCKLMSQCQYTGDVTGIHQAIMGVGREKKILERVPDVVADHQSAREKLELLHNIIRD